jgi:hypothetical protein
MAGELRGAINNRRVEMRLRPAAREFDHFLERLTGHNGLPSANSVHPACPSFLKLVEANRLGHAS